MSFRNLHTNPNIPALNASARGLGLISWKAGNWYQSDSIPSRMSRTRERDRLLGGCMSNPTDLSIALGIARCWRALASDKNLCFSVISRTLRDSLHFKTRRKGGYALLISMTTGNCILSSMILVCCQGLCRAPCCLSIPTTTIG